MFYLPPVTDLCHLQFYISDLFSRHTSGVTVGVIQRESFIGRHWAGMFLIKLLTGGKVHSFQKPLSAETYKKNER